MAAYQNNDSTGSVYLGIRLSDVTVYDENPTELTEYASFEELIEKFVFFYYYHF